MTLEVTVIRWSQYKEQRKATAGSTESLAFLLEESMLPGPDQDAALTWFDPGNW